MRGEGPLPLPTPPPPPEDGPAPNRDKQRCLDGNGVRGEVAIADDDVPKVAALLDLWLAHSASKRSACMERYHHAIAFVARGHEYTVLLCYSCGHYKLLEDGREVGYGAVVDPGGLQALNQLLEQGGVEGYSPDTGYPNSSRP
jgi:hypothetical protein